MIKRSLKYFSARLKSHVKAAPLVIAVSLITAAAIALAALAVIRNVRTKDDGIGLITIGITGDLDQPYVGIVAEALMDGKRSGAYMDFVLIDEADAGDAVRSGRIDGYLRVPEGFVESAEAGDFIPLEYVSEGSDTALSQLLTEEFMIVIDSMAKEMQSGVFALGRFLDAESEDGNVSGNLMETLSGQYALTVLDRHNTVDTVYTGDDEVPVAVYYYSSFTLFFIMIFGVGCASHLVKRDMSLSRMLSVSRVGALSQTVCELIAYFIYTFCFVVFLGALSGIVVSGASLGGEFAGASFAGFLKYSFSLAPVVLMIAAMQLFLYECVSGVVGGVLLQFSVAISLSYISGFFYPSSFFPAALQKFASGLPSGEAFSFAKHLFTGGAAGHLLPIVLYALLFTALTAVVRRIRIGGDAK